MLEADKGGQTMHIGLGAALMLLLFSYSLVDLIATDAALIRNLPKLAWLAVIILVPIVGPLCWIVLGRPHGAAVLPGTQGVAGPPRPKTRQQPLAPDDDPDFLRRLKGNGDDPRV
jgi:hypothetical protein